MPSKDDRAAPARGLSPRTAVLGLGLGAAAALGLALHPGPALAATAPQPGTFASWDAAPAAQRVAVQAEDEAVDPTEDDGVVEEEPTDDGELADDGALGDDEDLVEDEPEEADAPPVAVALDRRRRALSGPKAFAASRTARAGGLHWTGWGAATTTARGRLVVKKAGPRHRTLKAAGKLVLGSRTSCADGTPLYRRATFVVGRRTVATVALPGCSALR